MLSSIPDAAVEDLGGADRITTRAAIDRESDSNTKTITTRVVSLDFRHPPSSVLVFSYIVLFCAGWWFEYKYSDVVSSVEVIIYNIECIDRKTPKIHFK